MRLLNIQEQFSSSGMKSFEKPPLYKSRQQRAGQALLMEFQLLPVYLHIIVLRFFRFFEVQDLILPTETSD